MPADTNYAYFPHTAPCRATGYSPQPSEVPKVSKAIFSTAIKSRAVTAAQFYGL